MATGTCAASERGMGLQNWVTNKERMEDDDVIMDVVRNCLEGVVIRTNWVHNNIFGVHIHELGVRVKSQTHKWHIWFLPTHESTLQNQKSHFLPTHEKTIRIKNVTLWNKK
jgi:hypothetical protein